MCKKKQFPSDLEMTLIGTITRMSQNEFVEIPLI